MNNRFQELRKYIRFGDNGIEISAGENALKLVLDNNVIYFEQNGVQKAGGMATTSILVILKSMSQSVHSSATLHLFLDPMDL